MAQIPLTERRWTRVEYHQLGEFGILESEPVELIGGHLVVAEPKGAYHVTGVGLVARALRSALPPGWLVRSQDPIALDDESEPEPDVAVVRGDLRDYVAEHPERAVLVVEVADTSLAFDRRRKGSLYARGGIQDYWIVNLVDGVLEIYRDPAHDESAVYGWSYRSVARRAMNETVTLLALPDVRIAVSDLLP
ncbi:MAG: Uma2 family endonuclease [Candidatus Rokubacteria bacterium]|nr:Uma2 family endonuclease [Candidatus Rokubacteria bacterium]